MAKAYYRVSEFKKDVLEKRAETVERGFEIGFQSAYDFLNLKKKFTSYLYANPFSGKSSFVMDIYMFITKKYGAKIAIYSPESGGKEALVTYLVQVYLGKKLHGKGAQIATEDEWLEALDFIDNHFLILAPKVIGKDKVDFTTQEMFKQLADACKEYNWKLDILLIDPITMLRKSEEDRKKSVSDYILDNLYYINHIAEEWNIHIQIAMHTADSETIVDKETGIEYMGKPHPNRLHNGANVFRTGQTMFGLWRCPSGVLEKATCMPYPEDATDFLVQKNKILGAGEVGTFRLFFDISRQKFYEVINNKRYYCGEYSAKYDKKPTAKKEIKTKEVAPLPLQKVLDLPDDSPF